MSRHFLLDKMETSSATGGRGLEFNYLVVVYAYIYAANDYSVDGAQHQFETRDLSLKRCDATKPRSLNWLLFRGGLYPGQGNTVPSLFLTTPLPSIPLYPDQGNTVPSLFLTTPLPSIPLYPGQGNTVPSLFLTTPLPSIPLYPGQGNTVPCPIPHHVTSIPLYPDQGNTLTIPHHSTAQYPPLPVPSLLTTPLPSIPLYPGQGNAVPSLFLTTPCPVSPSTQTRGIQFLP